MDANAVSGSELLLDEAPAAACTGSPLPEVSVHRQWLEDARRRLRRCLAGALGKWVQPRGPLYQGRGNTAARLVDDTVYVAGGFCSPVGSPLPQHRRDACRPSRMPPSPPTPRT